MISLIEVGRSSCEPQLIALGIIRKAQGIRGELSMHPFSGEPERMKAYHEVYLRNTEGELSSALQVERWRVQGSSAVLQLSGITSRNQAEECRGAKVMVQREQLPELADDEYYWHELIGCRVELLDGTHVGRAASLFSNGAQDILVVTRTDGEEIFIPLVKEIFIEHSADRVIVAPPPGLLDANLARE